MKEQLLRFLDTHRGGLGTALAVLLYLVILAGQGSLGPLYGPAVIVLVLAMAALGVRWLSVQAGFLARLRAAVPLLLLGGSALLALAVRLWRVPAAMPAPGSDEAHFVEAALGIIRSGKYIPASLRYPSLLVYLELGTAVLRFVTGASANLWTWPTQLAPENLYGWGRALVALLGTATLIPVYRVGEKLYGRRAGLLAALFLALLPMHAVASRIVTPEVPAALLVVLALWFSLRLLEEGALRWALLAGLCAGLAQATHYPAALVNLVPLLAVLVRPARGSARAPSRGTLVLLTLAGSFLGLVLACPAAIFQVDRLVAGLAEAARAYFPTGGSAGLALRYLVLEGLGPGPAVLIGLGIVLIVWRLRRQDALLLAFPVLTYLVLLLPRARFLRDLVLLAPFLALVAAAGVERVCAWIEGRWPGRPVLRRWLPWAVLALSGGLFLLAVVW
jgi:4-amino-4-deoxy-L-arabinose transferase-like glycosyltransferase